MQIASLYQQQNKFEKKITKPISDFQLLLFKGGGQVELMTFLSAPKILF